MRWEVGGLILMSSSKETFYLQCDEYLLATRLRHTREIPYNGKWSRPETFVQQQDLSALGDAVDNADHDAYLLQVMDPGKMSSVQLIQHFLKGGIITFKEDEH